MVKGAEMKVSSLRRHEDNLALYCSKRNMWARNLMAPPTAHLVVMPHIAQSRKDHHHEELFWGSFFLMLDMQAKGHQQKCN